MATSQCCIILKALKRASCDLRGCLFLLFSEIRSVSSHEEQWFYTGVSQQLCPTPVSMDGTTWPHGRLGI